MVQFSKMGNARPWRQKKKKKKKLQQKRRLQIFWNHSEAYLAKDDRRRNDGMVQFSKMGNARNPVTVPKDIASKANGTHTKFAVVKYDGSVQLHQPSRNVGKSFHIEQAYLSKNFFCSGGGDSSVVGCPLTARWVAGSNLVDGRSSNVSWGICLCSGIRWIVSGYFDENRRSCKQ